MISFLILDLETNGILNTHEICELSIVRASDRMQITRQVRVDNPENSSLDALKVIGKTKDDLKKGVSKQQLIKDVERFLDRDGSTAAGRCLVGHNIWSFDRRFLWNHWAAQNRTFPVDLYLDTMQLMRAYAKKRQLIKPKLTLQSSCEMLKVATKGNWHTAKGDTQNCYFLWEALLKEFDYLDFIKTLPHEL